MKRLLIYSTIGFLSLCVGCGGEKKDYYAEAIEATRAGNNEAAVELFERSLKEHPKNARAHNYLGMLYMRMGDQRAAQRELEEAVAIDPSFGIAFNNLGTIYWERGMLEDARRQYLRAADLAPDLVQAHYFLGEVSARLALYEEAVGAFNRALETDPEFADARFGLGRVYAPKLDEKEKAKEHLKAYIKAAPGGDKVARAQRLLRELGEVSPVEFYNRGRDLRARGHEGKALDQFQKALAIDPQFAPAILEVAKVYDLQVKDKGKAVQYYERYLETNLKADDAPEVMGLLAKAREEVEPSLEKPEKREEELPRASTATPSRAEVVTGKWEDYRDRALALQRAGDHSAAIGEFGKAIELRPELDVAQEQAHSYRELGIEYMNKESFDDAVKSFQRALSLSPSHGQTEHQLGRAYAAIHQYEKGLESFERASAHGVSSIGKDVAAAYAGMGEEHFKAGRYGKAVESYEKALERNPSNAELHVKMAGLLKEGENYKRALDEYRKALDIDPNYAEAHSEAAKLLENRLNDNERALFHYKRYLQLAPDGPDAKIAAAAVAKLGAAVDQLRKYRKMVKNYPLRAEAHYNLAMILGKRGILEEAIAEYKKTIRLKPDFDRAYFNLGMIYDRRGYYARAIQMYQKATQLNPAYVKAYNNLGVLYSRRGRPGQALSSYEKALSADPGYAIAHYNIALLYKNLGKRDKALYHYKKYVEHAPGGQHAVEVKEILKRLGR